MEAEGTPCGEFMWDLAPRASSGSGKRRRTLPSSKPASAGPATRPSPSPRPLLSAIMGIGLEHTALLGPTIADIARDKAAIIKGNPALLYPEQPPEAAAEVMRRCAGTGARLHSPSFAGIRILSEKFHRQPVCLRRGGILLPPRRAVPGQKRRHGHPGGGTAGPFRDGCQRGAGKRPVPCPDAVQSPARRSPWLTAPTTPTG